MNRSLHRRLAAGLTLSFMLLAGLQWLLAGIAIERMLKAQLAQRLERDAENLLAALRRSPDGRLSFDAALIGGEYRRPFSGHYFRVRIDGEDDILSRSLWDGTIDPPPSGSERIAYFDARGPDNQSLWVRSARYERHAVPVRIDVAEDVAPLQRGLRNWHLLYGALTLAVMALVLVVQHRVVRRSLAPLVELQAQLRALEEGRRERIDVAVPDEIAPLVNQLNNMLSLVLRRSRRSREALGNLAHALKTRLAVLMQAAESPGLADQPYLRRTLKESTDLMHRAIERELRRARLMGGAHPAQRSNVLAAAEQLAATLAILHQDRSPDIRIDVDPRRTLAMDPEDLMELLGNLLDNACAWCDRTVHLSMSQDTDIRIDVEDDGPGCTSAQIGTLTERGFRADESRPGHGLGLAIVRDLVDSYGGALEFGHSNTLGGLRVTVHLPANPGLQGPNT